MPEPSKASPNGAAVKSPILGSVDNALDVLEAVAASDRGVGVSELARQLGLPKSTVFRLFAALSQRGYLQRSEPPGRYRLGLRVWEVGSAYLKGLSFRAAAHPVMLQVAGDLGETVYLTTYNAGAAVLIDLVEALDPVRWATPIGSRLPIHSTATGKVLLAFQPPGEIEQVLSGPLAPLTPHSTVDPVALQRELATIRESRWSVNERGWHPDVAGAAVPIFNHTGQVIAALGIAGPAERFLGKLPQTEPLLRAATATISRQIGHRG